jgi:hypothetical protein
MHGTTGGLSRAVSRKNRFRSSFVSDTPGRAFMTGLRSSARMSVVSSLASRPTTSPIMGTELTHSRNASSLIPASVNRNAADFWF